RQLIGALLSLAGVLVVLGRGEWQQLLQLRFVVGDLYMIVATIIWAFYSWMLVQSADTPGIRRNWATFLVAQLSFGLMWSALFAAGEWALTDAHIAWSLPLWSA